MNPNKLYIDDLFAEEFIELLEKDYEKKENLTVETLDDGIIIPFTAESTTLAYGTGGVIRKDGSYVKCSQTKAEALMIEPVLQNFQIQKNSDEEVVYLGYFIKQWGHFLVDFIPRLWWLVDHYKGQKIVYLVHDLKSVIDGNFLKLLEIFGIKKDKLIPVTEITRFKMVIVPETAFGRPDYYSQALKKVRDRIVANVDVGKYNYNKVYFTRQQLRKAKNCEFGEKYIETFFKNNGYTVLAPEKCSLEEQISIFNRCPHIASLSGTIPHNIIFGTEKTDLVIINKTTRINTTQILLNQAIGCKATYIDSYIALLPVSPATGPFWLEVNENLCQFAKERNMKPPKKCKLSMTEKKKILSKYFLVYCRNINQEYDIGGEIIGSSRPLSEELERKNIYYYYRNRLGYIDTDVSFESLLRSKVKNILRRVRKGMKK